MCLAAGDGALIYTVYVHNSVAMVMSNMMLDGARFVLCILYCIYDSNSSYICKVLICVMCAQTNSAERGGGLLTTVDSYIEYV